MNLNQITVQSTNISESIQFYCGLGLILIVESDDYARFECPEGDSTFSIYLVDKPVISNAIIYFEVSNLQEKVSTLTEQGYEFSQEVQEEPWLWSEALLNDYAGNEICLYNAGENRRNPPWRIEKT